MVCEFYLKAVFLKVPLSIRYVSLKLEEIWVGNKDLGIITMLMVV